MKFNSKFFAALSATAVMLATSANADAQWRKTWDFSKGFSEETVANLNADTKNWSANGQDSEGNNVAWQTTNKMAGTLTANDVPIAELQGLDFQTTGLGSGNNFHIKNNSKCFRITRKNSGFATPAVTAGQTITMIARSANGTATDRGFKGDDNLEYISGPAGGLCLGSEGDQTLVWKVKETVTDSVPVIISAITGGLDISLIMIDEGDAPAIEVAKKVAYVTNDEAGALDDARLALEGASDQVELTIIQSTSTDVTLDSLQQFEAVVVSPYVGVGDAMVAVLKSAIAYQPMLNLNAALYSTWALGEVAQSETTTLTVPEAALENALFAGIDLSEGLLLQVDGTAPYVTLGEYFADDAVLAYAGEGQVAIHQHNADRNSYIFVPVTDAVMNVEVLNSLVVNGVVAVAGTKKEVKATNAPAINVVYENELSIVTLSAAKGSKIYYTLDGTEPSEEATLYTEPFELTEKATVSAIATLDGYLQSKVATTEVIVKKKAAAPTFVMTKEPTSTTVAIECATEGVDIYYSFWNEGVTLTTAIAAKYTEPLVFATEPTAIYAFAAGEGLIDSDVAEDYVAIESLNANTIRMDTVSHFSACEAAWMPAEPAEGSTGKASAFYYWGKNAWSCYNTEEIIGEKEVVDRDENGDSIGIKKEPIYALNPEAIRIQGANEGNGLENDWRLFSQGQVLTGELQLSTEPKIGNGATGRFHEEATDLIGGPATKGAITFGGKGSGEPYTGAIESVVKFAAPFDVVVYVGNGNNGSAATMEVQTSADGQNWTTIGELKLASTQRYIKRNRLSVNEGGDVYVRVAHVGGSTKAQVYDVYVLNNGEVSQKYEGGTTGIEVIAPAAAEVKSVEVYTINGMRVAEPVKGINIIRTVYADGKVKVQKVAVR